MKLIQQSAERINQTDFTLAGIKKFIERCARISYKSENKITGTSYKEFVDRLIKLNHGRPLEFGTVHLRMNITKFHYMRDTLLINRKWNDSWIKYNYVGDTAYITTNYRYYLEVIAKYENFSLFITSEDNIYYPKRYTVYMITSRGVMDEFRTHIGLSHLAESTRYCNYSKDKFDNELTFIIPCWANTHCPNKENEGPSVADMEWSTAMLNAEASYLNLLKMGWKPQEAREVLPLGIKSELVSCGFKDDWDNFFVRRCARDAHPMAQELASKIKEIIYVVE